MGNIIEKFINTKKELKKYFDCKEDFFVKPLIENEWTIKNNDDIYFLTYKENDIYKDCVIVKKNNEPLIIKKDNYTMVIAIECIKLAFILNNKKEI